MFKAEPAEKKSTYYSIKEGTFRLKTTKEDPTAVAREYTNPKTKESGVAYERVYKALFGVVHGITFQENTLPDGTVLRSININLGNDEDGIAQVVSIPLNSRYTSDFLKKLPNVNLSQEVRLSPYDFEPDEGPRRVGLGMTQMDEDGNFTHKIGDFFVKVEEKDGQNVYTNLHGFPEATDEDKSDWPFYFKKVEKFLINYTKENILPKFDQIKPDAFDTAFPETETDINPDDIPF